MDTSGITHTSEDDVKVKFETLRAMEQGDTINMDSHMSDRVSFLIVSVALYLILSLY